MIRREDLQEELRKCQLDPVTYASLARMADLITVHGYLFPEPIRVPDPDADPPTESMENAHGYISALGESDFLRAADGMPAEDFTRIMDELMETLRVIHPKLYNSVMRKITE